MSIYLFYPKTIYQYFDNHNYGINYLSESTSDLYLVDEGYIICNKIKLTDDNINGSLESLLKIPNTYQGSIYYDNNIGNMISLKQGIPYIDLKQKENKKDYDIKKYYEGCTFIFDLYFNNKIKNFNHQNKIFVCLYITNSHHRILN